MALARLSAWRGENNDLHRRMGALRAGGASGAWVRGYGVNGWNISVEYGRRMPLRDHFYWTPQVELNYGRIGAADYTMRAGSLPGAHIANDAVTTLVGRIGTQIGCEDEHGTVYLKLGYLREFKGDLHMRAQYGSTSIDRSYSARDSYFEYGLGFTRHVGRADIYGELSRTAGADAIREKWKANLGVRVGF